MQEQLEDLKGRLSHAESMRQGEKLEDARLEDDVLAAATACRDVSHRGTLRDQALVSLKLRREQLQAAIRNARGQSLTNQRLTQEALLQLARLKELFNEEK